MDSDWLELCERQRRELDQRRRTCLRCRGVFATRKEIVGHMIAGNCCPPAQQQQQEQKPIIDDEVEELCSSSSSLSSSSLFSSDDEVIYDFGFSTASDSETESSSDTTYESSMMKDNDMQDSAWDDADDDFVPVITVPHSSSCEMCRYGSFNRRRNLINHTPRDLGSFFHTWGHTSTGHRGPGNFFDHRLGGADWSGIYHGRRNHYDYG